MHRRGRRVEGGAVLRAVGAARALPRPDAARPGLRERADGVHGHRTPPARPGDRDHAGLAQLRDVPLRLRTWLAARRGPGAAAVALAAQLLLPLVADRVALPRQRQVPAHLGAAVPALREERGPAADRRRRPRAPRASWRRRACRSGCTAEHLESQDEHADEVPGRAAGPAPSGARCTSTVREALVDRNGGGRSR